MKNTTKTIIVVLLVLNIGSLGILYKQYGEIDVYKGYIWGLLANESFDYEIPPTDEIVKKLTNKNNDLLIKEEILNDILQELKKGSKVRVEIIDIIKNVEAVNYYNDQATNDYHNKNIMNMKYEILRYLKK